MTTASKYDFFAEFVTQHLHEDRLRDIRLAQTDMETDNILPETNDLLQNWFDDKLASSDRTTRQQDVLAKNFKKWTKKSFEDDGRYVFKGGYSGSTYDFRQNIFNELFERIQSVEIPSKPPKGLKKIIKKIIGPKKVRLDLGIDQISDNLGQKLANKTTHPDPEVRNKAMRDFGTLNRLSAKPEPAPDDITRIRNLAKEYGVPVKTNWQPVIGTAELNEQREMRRLNNRLDTIQRYNRIGVNLEEIKRIRDFAYEQSLKPREDRRIKSTFQLFKLFNRSNDMMEPFAQRASPFGNKSSYELRRALELKGIDTSKLITWESLAQRARQENIGLRKYKRSKKELVESILDLRPDLQRFKLETQPIPELQNTFKESTLAFEPKSKTFPLVESGLPETVQESYSWLNLLGVRRTEAMEDAKRRQILRRTPFLTGEVLDKAITKGIVADAIRDHTDYNLVGDIIKQRFLELEYPDPSRRPKELLLDDMGKLVKFTRNDFRFKLQDKAITTKDPVIGKEKVEREPTIPTDRWAPFKRGLEQEYDSLLKIKASRQAKMRRADLKSFREAIERSVIEQEREFEFV